MPDFSFSVIFRKSHADTINGISQRGISEYRQHNVKQSQLPKLITELNEKGYELVRVIPNSEASSY